MKNGEKLKIVFILLFTVVFVTVVIIGDLKDDNNKLSPNTETSSGTEVLTNQVPEPKEMTVIYPNAEILLDRIKLYLNQYESAAKTEMPFHEIDIISDVNGINISWEFSVEYMKIPKEISEFRFQIDRLGIGGIRDGFPAFTINAVFREEESEYDLCAGPFEIETWFEQPSECISEGAKKALSQLEEELIIIKEKEEVVVSDEYLEYLKARNSGMIGSYDPEKAKLIDAKLIKGKEEKKGKLRREETEIYKKALKKMLEEDQD